MNIKIAFLCISILAVSATGPVEIALHNTGTSSTSKHQDSDGNYAFSYDIVDEHGASNSRSEAGDAFGNKKGSYTLFDTDGRARTVNYIADEHGFRVVVNTNEPGTAQSYPAGAIINSPYKMPEAPAAAAPISVVHEVPVPVPDHVTYISHPSKSIVTQAVPAKTFDYVVPVAVAHRVPSAYTTKSVISHDAPVAVASAVSVPHVHSSPLAYSAKSIVSHPVAPLTIAHSAPLAYSTKSIISHAAPAKAIAHATPLAITSPSHVSYPSKSLISRAVPVSKQYAAAPIVGAKYGSIYNGGMDFGRFGYNHGFLGHRLGGLAYDTKIYNLGLQGHKMRGLSYDNTLSKGYNYGYGFLRPYLGGFTYGNDDFHGYDGLKPFYY